MILTMILAIKANVCVAAMGKHLFLKKEQFSRWGLQSGHHTDELQRVFTVAPSH